MYQGNTAFNSGRYNEAVVYYRQAQDIEPELPHYTLNLAAAYLKLNQYAASTDPRTIPF